MKKIDKEDLQCVLAVVGVSIFATAILIFAVAQL